MILFFNLYFLLRWLHLFLYSFKSKNPLLVGIRRILGFSLMSEKEKELTGQTRFSNKGMKRRPTEKKRSRSKSKNKSKRKIKKNVKKHKRREKKVSFHHTVTEEHKDPSSKRQLLPDIDTSGGFASLVKNPANPAILNQNVLEDYSVLEIQKPGKYSKNSLKKQTRFTVSPDSDQIEIQKTKKYAKNQGNPLQNRSHGSKFHFDSNEQEFSHLFSVKHGHRQENSPIVSVIGETPEEQNESKDLSHNKGRRTITVSDLSDDI